MNCAVCNQPMKQIPAGISKSTGRPYNAFWACEDKSHKQPQAPRASYGSSTPTYQPIPTRDFDKEARGKIRHGLFVAFITGKSMKQINEEMSDFSNHLLSWENTIMNGVRKQHEQDFIQSLENSYPEEYPQ